MPGLSASDIVNVSVTLSPLPVPLRNFGALLIIGPTEGVINVGERLRPYSSITGVAADFGQSTPEYFAASLFFSQNPQPAFCYVGRWAQTSTHAWLYGATLTSAKRAMSVWTPVTAGTMAVTIDNTPRTLTGLDFSQAQTMNGVASVIQGALPAGATCTWNSIYNRFQLRGVTTGTGGTITYATATGSGTDISSMSGLSQSSGSSAPVNGVVSETPLQCVTAMASYSHDWYGCMFAPTAVSDITDPAYEGVANFIESQSPSRIFGITTQTSAVADPTQTTDLASALMGSNLQHTCIQYSTSSPYAIASLFGRAFTVDFTANNSVITLKFKQEPGITAEFLTESQATALKAKNCNVFVNYNLNVAIIQEGVMSGGYYFDERQGLDWLQNNVQTQLFNLLYLTPSKIPQTDSGVHILVTGVENAMIDGINNGLIAPGTWTSAATFGQLTQGQYLQKGYYVWAPSVASQDEATRGSRIAPTIQAAVKLAGAVHFANCVINVNR